jgi:hypothetical protein
MMPRTNETSTVLAAPPLLRKEILANLVCLLFLLRHTERHAGIMGAFDGAVFQD